MLEISNLSFSYPNSQFTIEIDQLKVAGGETLAVIGPSGSGKTTLLNLLAGILNPERGEVWVNSQSLGKMSNDKARKYRLENMGMVFQEFELLPYLSVFDNILLTSRLLGQFRASREMQKRAEELAEFLGIPDKLQCAISELSQGERQRVAICRALLLQPPVILADEPTGNLDPDNKHLALRKLIEETKSNNSALVTVTHDHSLLGEFDNVIDLNDLLATKRGD